MGVRGVDPQVGEYWRRDLRPGPSNNPLEGHQHLENRKVPEPHFGRVRKQRDVGQISNNFRWPQSPHNPSVPHYKTRFR